MDDALSLLLQEAIACDLTEEQLTEASSAAEQAITNARAAVSIAETALESNRTSINVREGRAANQAAEMAKRRAAFTKKYYQGTFKAGLGDEAALRIQEDAEHSILLDSIAYGENLIPTLHAAKRAATLDVLITSRNWAHAQGLVEACRAYKLFSPVLRNDPGAQINLRSSKASAYAVKITELENLINEFKKKEATYGDD